MTVNEEELKKGFKMKKITGIMIVILILFCGCTENDQFEEAELQMENITLNDYYKEIVYEYGQFYLLSDEEIFRYDPVSNTYTSVIEVSAETIHVNKNELFIFVSDGVKICDIDGTIQEEYPYSMEEMGIYSLDRCVADDKYIVITGWRNDSTFLEHKLFLIKRGENKTLDLTTVIKENAELIQIQGLDISDEKLLVTVKITSELDNDKNQCIQYNIDQQAIQFKKNLPGAVQAQYVGEDIYYYANHLVKRYNPESSSVTILRKYSDEFLSEQLNITWTSIQFKLTVAGNNILMISPHINSIYVDSINYDSEPLRILCPDNVSMYYTIEETIADYQAEHGVNVEIIELPMQTYQEKLLLRFLSFDSEFDLYYLPDIKASMTLNTILTNKQYLPLNGYSSVQKITEKHNGTLAEVIKDGDIVFGLPWILDTYFLEVNEEAFIEYDLTVPNNNWTLDDVWKLCETIQSRELPVRVFSTDMDIISHMMILWLEENCNNKESLTTLLERIQKFQSVLAPRNAGAYGDAENALLNISWQYNSANYTESDNKLLVFPRFSDNSTFRLNLNAAVLLNPNTVQADKASELLCAMYMENCNVMEKISVAYTGVCKPYLLGGDAVNTINQHIESIYSTDAEELSELLFKKISRIVFE